MITKYEKANKGKLLVAVLALFVVLAGAAVVLSDSDVSAEEPTAVTPTQTISGDYTLSTASQILYVQSDSTITISTASLSVDIYIKPGVTVTLAGEVDATSIEFFVVNADGFVNNQVTAVGTTDGALKYTASNSATNYDDKTYEAGSNFIKTNDTSTSIDVSGITVQDISASSKTYYVAGGSAGDIELDSGDSITITNGSATVSQGGNVADVSFASGNVTITGGTDGIPVIGSSGAGVSITSGAFTSTSDLTIANGVKTNQIDSSNYYFTSQIVTSISGVTSAGDITSVTVYGEVTQRSQVGNSSQTTSNALDVAFSGATFTINANVNVYADVTATGTNTLKIFGGLYNVNTTAAEFNTIYTGPNGYYNSTITLIDEGGIKRNTNVIVGTDYYINGVPSSPSVGDAVLNNTLTIPAGTTFTVTGNLGLNGYTIIVEGTLVIENRASIFGTGANATGATEGILIAGNGSIQNNGTIGKMIGVSVYYDADGSGTVTTGASADPSINMLGVSGVSYTINKGVMYVSGNVTATSGAINSVLTITGAHISGDFTTAKKVQLNLTNGATVARNSTVILNGDVTGTGEIDLLEGATISINGSVTTVTITADVGLLEDNTNLDDTDMDTITVQPGTNVTGFTVYVSKVAVANETTGLTDYYLRAYVNGTLETIEDVSENQGTVNKLTIGSNSDEYNFYIAAEETLTVGEDVATALSNVTVEGTIVFTTGATYTATSSVTSYIGATYTVETTGSNNQTLETVYFTTLAAAMDAIETANDEGVTAYVNNLDINVTVADGQVLNLNIADGGTISQDAVLTVENGGTLGGSIAKVDGKMVIQPDATSISPIEYDVMSTSEDGTVTYAGIAIAIAEAQPGDKITVESATIGTNTSRQSLTIPQGVEVTVSDRLTVYGDLTVAAEATLTGGSIAVYGTESRDAKITVNGTMDLSDGTLSGSDYTLASAGTTIVQNTTGINFNGAYYLDTDSNTVITTVANAVAYATENDVASVNVHGTVSETADLTLDGVGLVLDQSAKVTLGNVTLSGASIDADASGAELTATVSAMNGEGDGAVSGVVSVSKSALVLNANEVVNAAGTTVYTYTISAINGTMAVQSGTAVINSSVNTSAGVTDAKFTVATGATLLVTGTSTTLTVNGANVEFVVDGTLEVDNGATVAFSGTTDVPVINGTANIHGNGTIEASNLVINGTVNVSATENDSGEFEITGSGVAVGDVKEALGSTGSIVGVITFNGGNYLVAYAGTDMSGAALANDAEFETTAVYVNDSLYVTLYAPSTGVNYANILTEVGQISGISSTTVDMTAADSEGNDITSSMNSIEIGEYDAIYITAPVETIDIKVSVGSQISLYIDDVKYNSGETVPLSIGTHTVTATVNPGYTGDVTISFNGQTVTGGTIEITMDTAAGTVLSALGNISVDTGAVSSGDNGGMGIVEILLVILVVVVVILAIIVVLRMMRS